MVFLWLSWPGGPVVIIDSYRSWVRIRLNVAVSAYISMGSPHMLHVEMIQNAGYRLCNQTPQSPVQFMFNNNSNGLGGD
jgi:hypothetical protein